MIALLTELESRWQKLFSALAAGSDVAPSLRLRTEGLMEAAILCHAGSAEQLTEQMAACYLEAFGRSLVQDFGSDWQDFFPFPQIPAMAKRAPVYRSTKD